MPVAALVAEPRDLMCRIRHGHVSNIANSCNLVRMATPASVGTDSVVLLLTTLARVPRLPAHSWALSDAMSYVATHADGAGPLGRASKGIEQPPGMIEQLTRQATRHLVASGALRTSGRGWHAGYEVPDQTKHIAAELFDSLPPDDRRVLGAAAQRLVAMATIWSKNSRADLSSRSGTI